MDPLSIVASTAGLLMACGKATFLLHNFISSTQEVHSTITTLHADITSLAELLEDLKVLFGKREIGDVIDAGMDNFNGRVWRRAHGILESVGTTVNAIESLIERIEGKQEKGKRPGSVGSGKKKGIMKRGWMQLKMEFRVGDFELRHRQLLTQRSTLQIFLASITLCLQVHAENEQATATENILASISSLRRDVKNMDADRIRARLEGSTQNFDVADGIPNPFEDQPEELNSTIEQAAAESELIINNLEETLESAKEVIHSAQASIASRRDGSVRSNASVAASDQGSLFNYNSRRRIDDWVSGNIIEEESSDDSDPDTEDIDFELILSERLQVTGDHQFELRNFSEAEAAYHLSLQHFNRARTKTDSHQMELITRLAQTRARQQKWKDMENFLLPLTKYPIETAPDLVVLAAWQILAELKLHLNLFTQAELICRRVMIRRRTFLKKRHPAHEESMQLLVKISQAKARKLKEKAEELLTHGIDIESSNFDAMKDLWKAAYAGVDMQLIQLLLSLPDVEIDKECELGLTAAAYARIKEQNPVYNFFVGASPIKPWVEDPAFRFWAGRMSHLPMLIFALACTDPISDQIRDFDDYTTWRPYSLTKDVRGLADAPHAGEQVLKMVEKFLTFILRDLSEIECELEAVILLAQGSAVRAFANLTDPSSPSTRIEEIEHLSQTLNDFMLSVIQPVKMIEQKMERWLSCVELIRSRSTFNEVSFRVNNLPHERVSKKQEAGLVKFAENQAHEVSKLCVQLRSCSQGLTDMMKALQDSKLQHEREFTVVITKLLPVLKAETYCSPYTFGITLMKICVQLYRTQIKCAEKRQMAASLLTILRLLKGRRFELVKILVTRPTHDTNVIMNHWEGKNWLRAAKEATTALILVDYAALLKHKEQLQKRMDKLEATIRETSS